MRVQIKSIISVRLTKGNLSRVAKRRAILAKSRTRRPEASPREKDKHCREEGKGGGGAVECRIRRIQNDCVAKTSRRTRRHNQIKSATEGGTRRKAVNTRCIN